MAERKITALINGSPDIPGASDDYTVAGKNITNIANVDATDTNLDGHAVNAKSVRDYVLGNINSIISTEIVDNLESDDSSKALAASQGKVLKELVNFLAFDEVVNLDAMVVSAASEDDSTGKKYLVVSDANNSGNSTIYRCNVNVSGGETTYLGNEAAFDELQKLDVQVLETELSNALNSTSTTAALNLLGAKTLQDTKANKVSGAILGNFAGLDGTGDITDSGNKASDFEAAGTVTTHESTFDHSLLHIQNSDTSLDDGNPNQVTAAELRTHVDDVTRHRLINDSAAGNTDLWSAAKMTAELGIVDGKTKEIGVQIIEITQPILDQKYISLSQSIFGPSYVLVWIVNGFMQVNKKNITAESGATTGNYEIDANNMDRLYIVDANAGEDNGNEAHTGLDGPTLGQKVAVVYWY